MSFTIAAALAKISDARLSHENPEVLDALEETIKDKHLQLPVVHGVHPDAKTSIDIVDFVDQDKPRANCVFRIELPDGTSRLEWMPWLSYQQQPDRPLGALRKVKVFNKVCTEPRYVQTYGKSYAYGRDKGVQCGSETPEDVQQMMDTINSVYGLSEKSAVNMCLQNDYPTGRHCIGEHSDDEKLTSANKSVYCFVTGQASRSLTIRTKKKPKKRVMVISIPAGLYSMIGSEFQTNYTHQIPAQYTGMFNRLVKSANGFAGQEFKDMEAVEKAMFLKNTGTGRRVFMKGNKDLESYNAWALGRSSFTFRSFADKKRKRE